jgi:hypothetical protein
MHLEDRHSTSARYECPTCGRKTDCVAFMANHLESHGPKADYEKIWPSRKELKRWEEIDAEELDVVEKFMLSPTDEETIYEMGPEKFANFQECDCGVFFGKDVLCFLIKRFL